MRQLRGQRFVPFDQPRQFEGGDASVANGDPPSRENTVDLIHGQHSRTVEKRGAHFVLSSKPVYKPS